MVGRMCRQGVFEWSETVRMVMMKKISLCGWDEKSEAEFGCG